jgi:aspartyl-tRNA(Asn)/glutamyl-tRNA(Gln) amidotransferase subunit A
MMLNDTLCFQTIQQLASQIRDGSLSSLELTRAYLDRIEMLDANINCFITVTRDLAIRQAGFADEEIRAGKYRGILHGIPYAVKDLVHARGVATTCGSRLFADQIANIDGAVIEKLTAAGAVLLGKLSMTELAGGPPEAAFNGPVHNPWKLDHWTTGSSTGPAACTAAGFAAFTIGSETTASILGPASSCGIVGFRPTYGRVSRYGTMPLSWTMDKLGPLARCVKDCAAVFGAIHGADIRDPSSITAPFAFDPDTGVAGRRVAIVRKEFDRLKSQNASKPYDQAIDVLKRIGLTVEDIDLPAFPYREVSRFIWQVEAGTVFEPYARNGELQKHLINKSKWLGWKAAMLIPSADYMKVLRIRHAIVMEMSAIFRRYDALLAPMSPTGARQLGYTGVPPLPVEENGESAGLLTAGNIAGLPGLVVPCGFTTQNLPIGLAFVGGPMTDARILQIAHAYEQATTWHERRPTFSE